MNDARPRPGLPRRADGTPHGGAPIDKRPRVPPNPTRAPMRNDAVTLTPARSAERMREERTPVDEGSAKPLDARYERIDLPSGFAFYPWQDMSIRRVEPMDAAKIIRASRTKNLSTMLDAHASLITRDVRDLCLPDFHGICHWQKVNGYPMNTTTITWTSYGDRVTQRVKRTSLKTKLLERSRADALAWKERGIVMPTMRDLETIDTLDDPETNILFEHAQFVDPDLVKERTARLRDAGHAAPSVRARIEKFHELGMPFFALVEEFTEAFSDFGVDEVAELQHPEFDAERALRYLRERGTPEDLAEARRIETSRERGEEPSARKDVVPLIFDLWTMFPYA